jgi:diguanylate cyclase (GGDEF)-like protein
MQREHHLKHLRKWRLHLSVALEWRSVDKGLILIVMIIPIYFQYLLWSLYVLSRSDRELLVDVVLAKDVIQIEIALIAISIIMLAAGVYLRRRSPDLQLYQHVALQFFSLSLVLLSYSIGTQSFCAGLVLLGAPVFGFILLDRAPVWWAIGTALFALITLSYASTFGYIPYAPVVIPPTTPASSLFWMTSFFFFAAPFFVLILVMADQLILWWREREDKIRMLSRTDALTGLHNRMSIMDLLETEVSRSTRQMTPLSVVILDLDHFKKVNDTWGHPTGDLVLKKAAQILENSIRDIDAVGRYGGEEFIIILPGADLAAAHQIIERCRVTLAAEQITTTHQTQINVTASFGLVSMKGIEVHASQLIKTADEALYLAKHQGRNRIESLPLTLIPNAALAAT